MRLVALLTALWSVGAPAHGACLGGLKRILLAGGFSGSVRCGQDSLTARRVGEVEADGHRFTIFDYRYRLALICPECAVHGGRRTIVLRDGRYLGQYKTDLMRPSLAQGAFVLTPDGWPVPPGEYAGPVTVHFTAKGPPREVHVGGEDLEFFR
jgi:hypothetical protein